MEETNQTLVKEFILLSMTYSPFFQTVLFIVFLILYMFTLLGNICILLVVIMDRHLHTPMYILLGNLSFFDIVYSSTTVPKMMSGLMIKESKISVQNCIVQIFFFHFFGCTEAMLLTTMSYDRYVAICIPLRYNIIMAKSACFRLISGCWVLSVFYSLTHTILTSKLPFCRVDRINHFFCDIKPLLMLACADASLNENLVTLITGFLAVSTSSLIFLSYVFIGIHLVKVRSAHERRKAFSTCTSHLTVVFLFYGPLITRFLRPATNDSLEQDRQSALLYTTVTPVLNPLIYALRNQEVKRSLKAIFHGKKAIRNQL
ncbi:olfactory receptor 5V1 [Xenopus laevis]|uniref:Olfactory receptor n=1 Tax=Xenopus laevis TaxID=8355 RepID=A0A8J0TKL6_XENLA|nr:olfactory receptor 5V1 [Xenopus laevis]